MPSTYTVNLGIEKPATGEQSGTWGDTTNVNFDILDQAINGAERVTLTSAGSSGSPNSLQITNGATSDGRNKWLEFYSSSDLGGSAFVQLDPNDAEKIVFVRNSLAGSQSVILFQGTYNAARDLEVPAGVDMVVKFDGGGASAATVTDVFTKLRATEITTPTLTAGTADINGGTVDGAVIGGSSAAAITGTTVTANTSLNIAGDGATVTGIKDEDDMSSNSPTKLATQQSIKAYVDSQVGTVDTWAEVLANGATSGSTNPEVTAGQALKTNTINETSAGSGVTIDSVLLKDDVVNATDIETSSISANDGTAAATIANSTGVITIASSVLTTTDINGGSIDGTNIGASSTGTGAFTTLSATGNLTVDTDTLFVDASANTVGIGTTSNVASYKLQVQGANLLVGNAQSNNQISVTRTGSGATAIHLQAYSSNPAVSWDSGTLRFLNGGPLTINEDGGDYDFRVESNSNTHMFFVDAGNNRIGINNSSPSGLFELQNTSSTTFDATDTTGQVSNGATLSVQNLSDDTNSFSQILLRTRNASKSVSRIASLVNGTGTDLVFVNEPQGSDPAERLRITKDGKFGFNTSVPVSDVTISSSDDPVLTLRDGKSGSSWVAGDGLGQLEYYTSDGTGIADHAVARIKTISGGSNSAGPDGVIVFETAGYNSTPTERMRIGNTDNTVGGVIINEGSYNQDFRVESDSNTHMLFVDGGNNRVGVGMSTPLEPLHTTGRILSTTTYGSSTQRIGTSIGQNGSTRADIDFRRWTGASTNHGVGMIEVADTGIMRFYVDSKTSNTPATTERISLAPSGAFTTTPTTAGHAVFNEGGVDADFRVESDSNAHMLMVNAGGNRVGIGRDPNIEVLEVAGNLKLEASSAELNLKSGVAGTTGAINWTFNTDTTDYASIKLEYDSRASTGLHLDAGYPITLDYSASGDDGLRISSSGTLQHRFNSSGATFNENSSGNLDFRVESDGNSQMLFVDASANAVGIGKAPDANGNYALDVNGAIRFGDGSVVAGICYPNVVTTTRSVGSGSQWYKVYSETVSPSPRTVYLRINASGDNSSFQGDFIINLAGYNFQHSITLTDYQYYNVAKLEEIKTVNPGGATTTEIWVRVNAITGSTGTLTAQCSSSALVSSLSAASEPSATTGTAHLYDDSWPSSSNRISTVFSNGAEFADASSARFRRQDGSRSSYINHDTGGMNIATSNTGDNMDITIAGGSLDVTLGDNYEMAVNEGSAAADFRVESNNNTAMLFVDGTNDTVTVGTNSGPTDIGVGAPSFKVTDGIQIAGTYKTTFASPNGRVFTLNTGSNGAATWLKLEGSTYQGYRSTYYRCHNTSGTWQVTACNVVAEGTAPTFTVANNNTANPTITLGFNTSYSGGFVSVEMNTGYFRIS
jgi:hypothetical protein